MTREERAAADLFHRGKQYGDSGFMAIVTDEQLRNAAERYDAYAIDLKSLDTWDWGVSPTGDGRYFVANRTLIPVVPQRKG